LGGLVVGEQKKKLVLLSANTVFWWLLVQMRHFTIGLINGTMLKLAYTTIVNEGLLLMVNGGSIKHLHYIGKILFHNELFPFCQHYRI
jgi:hypothetical protein